MMRLIGIDLAWQSDKNPTAIAIGSIQDNCLNIESIYPKVFGLEAINAVILETNNVKGIAIDAPLIIDNVSGQRDCERELSTVYGARKASCHTSNKTLYPNAKSVSLSKSLFESGYSHLEGAKWQIECYPHPAIIECFGLQERLLYKKGIVSTRKNGQIQLASYIQALSESNVLRLNIPNSFMKYLNQENVLTLKGQQLKSNEDALDAIICLYIAALKHIKTEGTTFGNVNDGYIWVPKQKCI
jgi:predicted RNase H-like nuclease